MNHAHGTWTFKTIAAALTAWTIFASSARAAAPADSGDGTLVVSPAYNNAPGSTTNVFKFSFRADASGTWSAGAQVRLTIPSGWTEPQTNAAGGPGYVKATLALGTAVSIDSISGTGPWDVTVNYQGANGTTRGFDLSYTNVTAPATVGDYAFIAASRQAGSNFVELATNPVITVVTRQDQAISFPPVDYVTTPNGLAAAATASSGLPVTFSVAAGPATLSGGSNLAFSATGTVKVVAAQAGNVAWYPAPSVTNTFPVFAGGAMTVSPALAMAACATNVVKFQFRGDGIGAWQAGSQIRITIPPTWTPPQTNAAANPGYVKTVLMSGTAVSVQSITGAGPWDVVVNYQGNKEVNRGFDLVYTNLTTPSAAGVHVFPTASQQRGVLFTNAALETAIELVDGSDQTLSFPPLPDQLSSNDVTLGATASSGLPVAYAVAGGPGTIANGVLSFTSTGRVSVSAYQGGNAYWRPAPPLTNTLMVFAGGTVTVTPTNATAGSATNAFKFSMRADGVGAWGTGSQVRLTIPSEWPQPQTNSAAAAGYISAVTVGTGGTLTFAGIEGAGPWDVIVNYAGANTATKGFDLTYTNLVVPGPEAVYPFPVVCRQFGTLFTNAAMAPAISVVVKTNQTLDFPAIPYQLATNKVVLTASASSGLPVSFTVLGGPGSIAGGTNLTFTSTGVVRVAASQAGNGDWHPAPSITNAFMVFAGGSLAVTPAVVTAGSTTNALKFSFRADGIGAWGPGSQLRLTIPATWPAPQTSTPDGSGYLSAVAVGTGGTVSFGAIEGTGPWEVIVQYAGTATLTKGFDLVYTNLVIPGPEALCAFPVVCRQFGQVFTNANLAPAVMVLAKTSQTIEFPAIDRQFTTNRIVMRATASSGLPVGFSLMSGPATLAGGTNLTFTSTGMVRVAAYQGGTEDWDAAVTVTNTFIVFAGGTLALSPAMATAGSATNALKFSFRTDGDGTWGPESQLRLIIPAEWPTPQTNASANAGYISVVAAGTISALSLAGIEGEGPWDVVVNFAGGPTTSKGFDLTYTNLVIPGPETVYAFPTVCRQFGMIFTNETLRASISVISKTNQTIDFPAIGYQMTTNKVFLNASASSGLPVAYAVSGPGSVTGSNLTFTGTGMVSVVASQAGNMDWHPALPVTNTFRVFAGGAMTLSPAMARHNSTTNGFKFAFRCDDVAAWQAGSQVRITIPAAWPRPQTNSPSIPGYVRITPVSAIASSIDSITGDGPWDLTVNHQSNKDDTRGFDLVYTNIVIPPAGAYPFDTACQQAGLSFTNPVLNRSLTIVEGTNQEIDVAVFENPIATNKVGLRAAATSGLPVVFTLESGPATLAAGTNLTFSGTGTVVVSAAQTGSLYWNPASTSVTFTVLPAMLAPAATIKNKTYNGVTGATINSLTMTGKASGDSVTLEHDPAFFDNRNVGTGKQVTISGLSITGSDAPKYQLTITTVTSTASILPRSLMVQAATDAKIYDGTPASVGVPAITNGSLVGGDTEAWSQSFDSKAVGAGKTLTPSGTVNDGNGGANYTVLFYGVSDGSITPRSLTVSGASARDKNYDGTTTAVITGAVLVGWIEGDEVDLDALAGEFAQADPGTDIPVTAWLTLKGADAGNYSLVQPSGLAADILSGEMPEQPVISGGGMEIGAAGPVHTLNWQGQEGCTFHVEYTDSLSSPWAPLPGCTGVPGSNGILRAADTNGLPACRFYRIIKETP